MEISLYNSFEKKLAQYAAVEVRTNGYLDKKSFSNCLPYRTLVLKSLTKSSIEQFIFI